MHIKSGIRKRAIITTILACSSWGLGGGIESAPDADL